MMRRLVICVLFWAGPAWADDLGCFEPGATVTGATMNFTGDATSVVADVYDPDDSRNGTGYAEPTMTDRDSVGARYWTAASFTAGSTVGKHEIHMHGTVSGADEFGVDTFVVSVSCLPAIPANWLTAAGIAAGALNGKGDWNIGKTGYALSAAGTLAIWHEPTANIVTASTIGLSLKALGADWADGGRLDLLLDGIKAKTDPLTFTATNFLQVDPRYWNGTVLGAVQQAGWPTVTIKTGTGTGELSCTAGVCSGNLVQIAGVAQDATDLGDFAAQGYDPATNKVQGVVLTDTTTAVTNDVNLSDADKDDLGYFGTVTITAVNNIGDGTGNLLTISGLDQVTATGQWPKAWLECPNGFGAQILHAINGVTEDQLELMPSKRTGVSIVGQVCDVRR